MTDQSPGTKMTSQELQVAGLPQEIHVWASYSAYGSDCAELPAGIYWHDVASWGIKWGTLYLTMKNGTLVDVPLNLEIQVGDTKWPDTVEIHDAYDGDADYDRPLD